jgi:hypothetical protein
MPAIPGTTRACCGTPPFIDVSAQADGGDIPLHWRCQALPAFAARRRINPQLGWSEWCDTRNLPVDWQRTDFDDRAWPEPVAVARAVPAMREPCPPLRHEPVTPQLTA